MKKKTDEKVRHYCYNHRIVNKKISVLRAWSKHFCTVTRAKDYFGLLQPPFTSCLCCRFHFISWWHVFNLFWPLVLYQDCRVLLKVEGKSTYQEDITVGFSTSNAYQPHLHKLAHLSHQYFLLRPTNRNLSSLNKTSLSSYHYQRHEASHQTFLPMILPRQMT